MGGIRIISVTVVVWQSLVMVALAHEQLAQARPIGPLERAAPAPGIPAAPKEERAAPQREAPGVDATRPHTQTLPREPTPVYVRATRVDVSTPHYTADVLDFVDTRVFLDADQTFQIGDPADRLRGAAQVDLKATVSAEYLDHHGRAVYVRLPDRNNVGVSTPFSNTATWSKLQPFSFFGTYTGKTGGKLSIGHTGPFPKGVAIVPLRIPVGRRLPKYRVNAFQYVLTSSRQKVEAVCYLEYVPRLTLEIEVTNRERRTGFHNQWVDLGAAPKVAVWEKVYLTPESGCIR